MPVNTPEPRLPLEPEEYPLYKPPSRIGCSGLTFVALVSVLAFAVLFRWVTPQLAKSMTDVPKNLFTKSGDATPETAAGAAAITTQTTLAQAPPTQVPTPKPTPVIEYVKVANTGGSGVKLRSEPRSGARYSTTVGEGATFKIIGPDVPDPNKSIGIWRHVELPNDGRNGYVLSKFLIPTTPP